MLNNGGEIEVVAFPCLLGGRNLGPMENKKCLLPSQGPECSVRGKKSEMATSTLAFSVAKIRQYGYIAPALSMGPNAQHGGGIRDGCFLLPS